MILDRKFWQEWPVNAGLPQSSMHGTTFFILYINDRFDVGICNISCVSAVDSAFYSKCEWDS